MKKEKSLDIELMRILAAYFVIFNHTQKYGFGLYYAYWPFDIHFIVYRAIAQFCTFSVPLFYMIFGALMLNREPEPYAKVLRRMGKMGLVLVFWSGFYYLVDVFQGLEPFHIGEFFLRLYYSNLTTILWYLYSYLALLASLPLLQRFVQNLTDRDFCYLIGIFLLFSCLLPTAEFFLGQGQYTVNNQLNPGWLTTNILFYPCLGYFLRHRIRNFWNGRRAALLWACNIVGFGLTGLITGLQIWHTGDTSSQGVSFVCVHAATIFVSCQYLFDRVAPPLWVQKAVLSLGSCSFGVYLLHIFFMFPLGTLASCLSAPALPLNPMLMALIYCVGIFLLCYAVTLVLRKIPGVRFFVNG